MASTLGRLREVIRIDAETAQDEDDEAVPAWTEIGVMRAEARPVRASETEREGALRTVQVYLFTVLTSERRRVGVSSLHRIRWGSMAFNVREVRVPSDNVALTEIVAETGVTL